MYLHTIAIARSLLSEGRLADVDRMISPLLAEAPSTETASDEVMLLRCLLAKARLFSGTSPETILQLFPSEDQWDGYDKSPRLEGALVALCLGWAYAIPETSVHDLPKAVHLLHHADEQLQALKRCDYRHWTQLGLAIACYELKELEKARVHFERASSILAMLEDQVAHHWHRHLAGVFEANKPIPYASLFQVVPHDRAPACLKPFVHVSDRMETLLHQCQVAAPGAAPVLLIGERGAGKEETARLIHALRANGTGQFIALDCETLTEPEPLNRALFSEFDKESASRKTLFLNHIEKLPAALQRSLLTFLQQSAISGHFQTTSVRLISASSGMLENAVAQGRFDDALYHLLKINTLTIPPLRMRKQDIPILALHYSKALRPKGVSRIAITDGAIDALLRYDWPGNVRQLRNEIERILVNIGFEPLPTINLNCLSKTIRSRIKTPLDQTPVNQWASSPLGEILARTEKSVIERVLSESHGQVSSAAAALGLTRQGLYKKLKRLGIRLKQFSLTDRNN